MKLMTKALEKKIPNLHETDNESDLTIKVKYFNPCGAGTWYGIEYDPINKIFFGYVDLYGNGDGELGYFSLEELESIRLPFGLKIERDLYFDEVKLSSITNKKEA